MVSKSLSADSVVNLLILFRKQGSCKSSEENWPDHSSAHHYSPAVPRYRVSSGMISPRNKPLIVSLFTSVLRKFNNNCPNILVRLRSWGYFCCPFTHTRLQHECTKYNSFLEWYWDTTKLCSRLNLISSGVVSCKSTNKSLHRKFCKEDVQILTFRQSIKRSNSLWCLKENSYREIFLHFKKFWFSREFLGFLLLCLVRISSSNATPH